jgi:hypothetical protein
MTAAEPTVRVGVAAFIPNAQGALVVGKRKGKSGDGEFVPLPYVKPSSF